MKRTIFLLTILALSGLAATNPAQAEEKKAEAKKAAYVHSVVIYLKKDAPKDAETGIVQDSHKLLAKIPSVRGLSVGRPAEKSTPKFAKTDYQLGLLVLFDDYDGLKAYLEHPLHQEFVDKHEKHMENVVVYDFVNQQK